MKHRNASVVLQCKVGYLCDCCWRPWQQGSSGLAGWCWWGKTFTWILQCVPGASLLQRFHIGFYFSVCSMLSRGVLYLWVYRPWHCSHIFAGLFKLWWDFYFLSALFLEPLFAGTRLQQHSTNQSISKKTVIHSKHLVSSANMLLIICLLSSCCSSGWTTDVKLCAKEPLHNKFVNGWGLLDMTQGPKSGVSQGCMGKNSFRWRVLFGYYVDVEKYIGAKLCRMLLLCMWCLPVTCDFREVTKQAEQLVFVNLYPKIIYGWCSLTCSAHVLACRDV